MRGIGAVLASTAPITAYGKPDSDQRQRSNCGDGRVDCRSAGYLPRGEPAGVAARAAGARLHRVRSEERRVGEEWRARWWGGHVKRKVWGVVMRGGGECVWS